MKTPRAKPAAIVYRSNCCVVGARLLVTTTLEAGIGIPPGRYPGAITVVESGTAPVLYHKVRPIPRHGGMRYETGNGEQVLEILSRWWLIFPGPQKETTK